MEDAITPHMAVIDRFAKGKRRGAKVISEGCKIPLPTVDSWYRRGAISVAGQPKVFTLGQNLASPLLESEFFSIRDIEKDPTHD